MKLLVISMTDVVNVGMHAGILLNARSSWISFFFGQKRIPEIATFAPCIGLIFQFPSLSSCCEIVRKSVGKKAAITLIFANAVGEIVSSQWDCS